MRGPNYPEKTIVSHQLSPGAVLALAHEFYGGNSTSTLCSIRGHDFVTELSPETATGVGPAVGRIWAMYQPVNPEQK